MIDSWRPLIWEFNENWVSANLSHKIHWQLCSTKQFIGSSLGNTFKMDLQNYIRLTSGFECTNWKKFEHGRRVCGIYFFLSWEYAIYCRWQKTCCHLHDFITNAMRKTIISTVLFIWGKHFVFAFTNAGKEKPYFALLMLNEFRPASKVYITGAVFVSPSNFPLYAYPWRIWHSSHFIHVDETSFTLKAATYFLSIYFQVTL